MMSGPEGTVPKDPQRFRNAASMPEYDSPATSVSRHPQEVRPRCRRRPRTCLTHGWEPGMVTITSLAKDEKDARIALAAVLEPDDAVTGRLLAAVGAVETVRLAAGTGVLPETIDPVEGELWRGKVAPRNTTIARRPRTMMAVNNHQNPEDIPIKGYQLSEAPRMIVRTERTKAATPSNRTLPLSPSRYRTKTNPPNTRTVPASGCIKINMAGKAISAMA